MIPRVDERLTFQCRLGADRHPTTRQVATRMRTSRSLVLDRPSGPSAVARRSKRLPAPARQCYRYIDALRLFRPDGGYDFEEMYVIYRDVDWSLSDQCARDYDALVEDVAREHDTSVAEVAKAVRQFERDEEPVAVGSDPFPHLLVALAPRSS